MSYFGKESRLLLQVVQKTNIDNIIPNGKEKFKIFFSNNLIQNNGVDIIRKLIAVVGTITIKNLEYFDFLQTGIVKSLITLKGISIINKNLAK